MLNSLETNQLESILSLSDSKLPPMKTSWCPYRTKRKYRLKSMDTSIKQKDASPQGVAECLSSPLQHSPNPSASQAQTIFDDILDFW